MGSYTKKYHNKTKQLTEEIMINNFGEFMEVTIIEDGRPIGDITLETSDGVNYTIVLATIIENYRGRGFYKKAIIDLLNELPDIHIISLFRSDDAERAWVSLLKTLPNDIKYQIDTDKINKTIRIYKK